MASSKNGSVRRQRGAAGLCYGCGKVPEPGKRTCTDCLARDRRRYAELRAAGLCYCGRKPEPGRRRCQVCLGRSSTISQTVRVANVAAGRCFCGGSPRPGKMTCELCAARNLEAAARRRDAGLCRCGKNPPAPGKTTCQSCRDYKAVRLRELREQVVRGYGGCCVNCGEDDPNVLELDHVANDGGKHRRETSGPGNRMYAWAVENGFPARLQLLCASCHLAKTRTGDCSYRRGRRPRPV